LPEGIEVESYRRTAEAVIGRRVASVDANDSWYLKGGTTAAVLESVLVGSRVLSARRIGKLLMLDVEGGFVLGLRFGMTGRLIVDGDAPIEVLEYSSARNDPTWDRFGLGLADGGLLVIRDPRRLGGVELDPDETALGVDIYCLTGRDLGRALTASSRSLKALLMDQSRIAGLGNLLTDEILWRASLAPDRPGDSLSAADRRRLLHHLRVTVEQLTARGGSHTGDLYEHRVPGGVCPRDGCPLLRRTTAGRTTYSCPRHQAGQDKSTR
jgi:formamidopyrimidine-DNA glycosylase